MKLLVKRLARRLGYDVRRARTVVDWGQGLAYGDIVTAASYSPWEADRAFGAVYAKIAGNTLVDRYRCYGLWEAVREAAKAGDGDILEVGTWRGGTGCLMAQRARSLELKSRIFLCDTFTGVVKVGGLDGAYTDGSHGDASRKDVEDLARQMGLEDLSILVGMFPEETGHAIENRVFRMCHIDVDIYQSSKDIFAWVWPRLVPGGMVVVDDYGYHATPGVTRFANEERERSDCRMTYNLNGQAVFVKV